MGFSRLDLFFTFLFQALFLGASGVLLGGLVALALVRYLVAHPIFDWQGFVVRPVLSLSDVGRTAGTILVTTIAAGSYPASLSETERTTLRRERLGFVFQQSNLLPELTARENVALPAWRATGHRRNSLARADDLLTRFGLARRAEALGHVPSLGEAQRVAVARAIINGPRLVLADEPTGSLDSEAANAVLDALAAVCLGGAALLVVTHAPSVAARCTRRLVMRDGRITSQDDLPSPALTL
jgi:putative ABC transport system ATP-binding protein